MSWPDTPIELPSRQPSAERLAAALAATARDGSGHVLLVTGEMGSGRSTLVAEQIRQVVQGSDRVEVVGRRFTYGQEENWDLRRHWKTPRLLQVAGAAAQASAPVLSAVGQPGVAAGLRAAGGTAKAASKAVAKLEQLLLPDLATARRAGLLRTQIRRVALTTPVVCVLDDLDYADHLPLWWDELLQPMALEAENGLPVLLIVTVESGAPLTGEISGFRHRFAGLVTENLADALHLPPLERNDLTSLLSRDLELGVVRDLASMSGGNLAVLRMTWEELTGNGAIAFDEARLLFTWSRPPDDRQRHALLMDALSRQLRRLLADDEAATVANRVLGIAALEGPTFTAAAVAEIAEMDPDELIDLLDDRLALDDPSAVLAEAPAITLDGGGVLWRYRFTSPDLWAALSRLGMSQSRRSEIMPRYAEALLRLYAGEWNLIAGTAARLLEQSDPAESARLADEAQRYASKEILFLQAELIGDAVAESTDVEVHRWVCDLLSWIVGRLSDLASIEYMDYEERERLGRIAELLIRSGSMADSPWHLAVAQWRAGQIYWKSYSSRDKARGKECLVRADTAVRRTSDRWLKVEILQNLMQVGREEGDTPAALRAYEEALAVAGGLGDDDLRAGLLLDFYYLPVPAEERKAALLEAARVVSSRSDDARLIGAIVRSSLRRVEYELGNFDRGYELHEQHVARLLEGGHIHLAHQEWIGWISAEFEYHDVRSGILVAIKALAATRQAEEDHPEDVKDAYPHIWRNLSLLVPADHPAHGPVTAVAYVLGPEDSLFWGKQPPDQQAQDEARHAFDCDRGIALLRASV
jgi:AAA ATPase domain